MEELKPCPFCGSIPIWLLCWTVEKNEKDSVEGEYLNCIGDNCPVHVSVPCGTSREDQIKAWNQRV